MRLLILAISLLFFLLGCSHLEGGSSRDSSRPKTAILEKKAESKRPVSSVVWKLMTKKSLILILKKLDQETMLDFNLVEGISEWKIPKGDWEIVGIKTGKESFVSSDGAAFILHVKSNTISYGGSLLFGCPQIANSNKNHLKKLKFFDRYTFESDGKICELIIGDDLVSVENELRKTRNTNNLKLEMGF